MRAGELLCRHGLQPKKSWGQNFLVDVKAVARIVAAAGATPNDTVVEIGAGLGALTGLLLDQGVQTIAVEHDRDLVKVLQEELGQRPGITIVAGDAMEFDLAAASKSAGRPLIVVGNLPYQITSPLIFKMLDEARGGEVVRRAVFMVQREFAERMVAAPGGKIYGRLSVMAQQQAAVQILFHVGSGSFLPRPAVTSTVLSIVPRPRSLAPVRDERLFAAVVRAAFGARRKMLRGSLAGFENADAALEKAGILGTRRAEELSVADFGRLADALAGVRDHA